MPSREDFGHDAYIGHLKNGGLGIFVDGDHKRIALDPAQMLEGAADAQSHVDLGLNGLPRGAHGHWRGSNRTIIKQACEMLVSNRTNLAATPVGPLVTLDRVYELVDGKLSNERRTDIHKISKRFKGEPDKNWETDKKALDPKPRDRNEIVRNTLRSIFAEPSPRTYRHKNYRTFQTGISVETMAVGDEGDISVALR